MIIDQAIPLATGQAIAHELRRCLIFGQRRYHTTIVGSISRGAPISKDIDLLVIVPDDIDFNGILASAVLRPDAAGLSIVEIRAGPRRASAIVKNRRKYYVVDLFLATNREKPYALFHFLNDRIFNIRTRAHAKHRGWKLNQYGIFIAGTNRRVPGSNAIKTKQDLARFLGV